MRSLRIAIFLLGGMALFGRAAARRERRARDGASKPNGDGVIERSPSELLDGWASPGSPAPPEREGGPPAPPRREGRRAPKRGRRRLAAFLILAGVVLVG